MTTDPSAEPRETLTFYVLLGPDDEFLGLSRAEPPEHWRQRCSRVVAVSSVEEAWNLMANDEIPAVAAHSIIGAYTTERWQENRHPDVAPPGPEPPEASL